MSMKGDFTRFSFLPENRYQGVRLQQGRVQLDADWNELVELVDRRLRAETTDIVGRAIVPRQTPDGFKTVNLDFLGNVANLNALYARS